MNKIKIVLPKERPVSWNQIYSSRHWIFRKNIADSVHRKVVAALVDMGIHVMDKTKLFETPVDINIIAYFDKHPLDPDNIGAKLYIDPLKLVVIHNDTPQYVHHVTTSSEIDRKNPRLEIELTPCPHKKIQ